MKLLLHLGIHRTGTTSFQHHLASHRDTLLAQGFYYPNSKRFFSKGGSKAHFAFGHGLAVEPHSEAMKSFVLHLEKAGREGYTVIISSEPLYRHIIGGGSPETYVRDDYWKKREDYLRLLRQTLSRFDVKPYIVFRRQDTFIESLFSQSSSNSKNIVGQFAPYRESRRVLMMYAQQLEVISRTLGKPDIFLYERTKDMVKLISQAMRLSLPEAADRHYQSLDPRLVLWASEAGDTHGLPMWEHVKSVITSDEAAGLAADTAEGAGAVWSPSEREAFLESFRDENARFGEMIGDKDPFPAMTSAKPKASVPAPLKESLDDMLAGYVASAEA